MATVTLEKRPRKKGCSYVVKYVDPETKQKRYHGTFKTWREADKEITRLKVVLDGGEMPESPQARNRMRGKTFGEIAALCEEEWKRRVKEGSLGQRTLEGYLGNLKRLAAVWGGKPMGILSEKVILDFRADEAHKNSPASANRYLFIVKQVFKRAVKEGVLKADPAREIGYLNEEQHERKKFLKPEQVDMLIAKAGEGRAKHYLPLAILLAVEHGCSRQEVLDLKWADIDFNGKGLIRFFRTKNRRERLHHLMPRTRDALIARRAHLEERRTKRSIAVKGDHVVGHLDGTRMGEFKSAWKNVCKACGLDDLHFHDNRHTYCSSIVLAGGKLAMAGALIGHKDLRMTKRYTNLEELQDNPAQERLAQYYAKAGNSD